MALRIDKKGLSNAILNKLQKYIEYAFDIWESDVYKGLKHPGFGEGIKPEVGHYFSREGNVLIGYLQANPYVLADSYGTGSLMLDNNPGLAEYKASARWNPDRNGKKIVGRAMGVYRDTFGRARVTSGKFKGKILEGRNFNGYHIAPTHPSYAIQIAEKWLYEIYLPKMYDAAISEINFSQYLIES